MDVEAGDGDVPIHIDRAFHEMVFDAGDSCATPDMEVVEAPTATATVSTAILIKYMELASQDLCVVSQWVYERLEGLHPAVEEYLGGQYKELTLTCLYFILSASIVVIVFVLVGVVQALWGRLVWGASYREDESYKETATNLANSMRMLIDKQSSEMHAMSVEKRRLQEHINTLQSELDRIVSAIENSNGEPGTLHAIAARGNRVRLGSGNDGGRNPGPSPSRGAVSSLRRNRDRAPGDSGGIDGSSRGGLTQPQSIASDSLASTIAANAALLSGNEQSESPRSPPKGVRGIFQRLARAIPETDEHPVLGYMPSPTPRTRR